MSDSVCVDVDCCSGGTFVCVEDDVMHDVVSNDAEGNSSSFMRGFFDPSSKLGESKNSQKSSSSSSIGSSSDGSITMRALPGSHPTTVYICPVVVVMPSLTFH